MKPLYHSWSGTGSAYTSNGITGFLREADASLPETVEKVFFRADNGFFSAKLFDLLESYGWDYLVKVRTLKNCWRDKNGQSPMWKGILPYASSRTGRAKGWKKTRTLRAIKTVKAYVEMELLGGRDVVPVYRYALLRQ